MSANINFNTVPTLVKMKTKI